MITEDYVSFETAKLLKEKGFDECPLFRYDDCGYLWIQGGYNKTIKWHFPAPTLQMAIKWLREEHNLFIQITVDFSDGIYPMYDVYIVDLARCTFITVNGYDRYLYIKAAEAGIKYCLENLI